MAQETLLTIFVIIAALALLLQASLLAGMFFAVRSIQREVGELRADVKRRLEPLSDAVTGILVDAREPLRAIITNTAEISQVMRDRARRVDAWLEDAAEKGRQQLSRLDQVLGDVADKVRATTDEVQRTIMEPIREVSALVKGVQAGLDFLFSRGQAKVSSAVASVERKVLSPLQEIAALIRGLRAGLDLFFSGTRPAKAGGDTGTDEQLFI